MSDYEDDLPDVCMNTPKRPNGSKINLFNMPDAREVAEKRKIELALDEKVNKILSGDISLDEATNDDNLESVLQFDLNLKESKIESIFPGIEFDELYIDTLLDIILQYRIDFLQSIFETIIKTSDEHLEAVLNIILKEMEDTVFSRSNVMEFQDLLCYTVLICSILLEKRCRSVITKINKHGILWGLFKRVPADLQSKEFLMTFTTKLMILFRHFHNRLYLAECLERVKCDPLLSDTVALYFSNRLSKYILHYTLYDLVRHDIDISPETKNNFCDLKKVVLEGRDSKSLGPYEHYILIRIMNMLSDTIAIPQDSQSQSEIKAKKWFLKFFASFKSKGGQKNMTNVDLSTIKLECECINLLWRKDIEPLSQNSPKKN